MTAAPLLRINSLADLEEYPVGRDVRLDGHSFTKWEHNRWLASAMCLCATYEAKGMARDLFDHAQNQSPVGTLPDDDWQLSRMLRIDQAHWKVLREQRFGPLHGWERCTASGEVRLMHRVVLAQVQDALNRREMRSLSKEEQAERKRFQRLADGLAKLGVDEAVLGDGILMGRMDVWLSANCKGNRTREAYEAALVAARKEGWLGSAR